MNSVVKWSQPRTIEEALTMAGRLVKSGMLPKAIRTPENALAIMAAGSDFSMSPMESFRALHVVDGKVEMSAQYMLARIRGSGLAQYIKPVEVSDKRSAYVTKRVDEDIEHAVEFNIEDAKAAGLLGRGNWSRYIEDMLNWRAISRLARRVYPDVLYGCYVTGEISDAPPINVTPEPAAVDVSSEFSALIERLRASDSTDDLASIRHDAKKIFLDLNESQVIALREEGATASARIQAQDDSQQGEPEDHDL